MRSDSGANAPPTWCYPREAAFGAAPTNSPKGEYALRLPKILPLLGGEGRGEGERFIVLRLPPPRSGSRPLSTPLTDSL